MHPHHSRARRRTAAVQLACAVALIAATESSVSRVSAQARFRGGIDLVEADAVVIGGDGHPATGLTAADFVLAVDGQPRAIETVEFVNAGAAGASRPAPAAGSHDAAPVRAPQRHVVFVVDEGNISAGGGKAATAAAARMLDRLGPSDRLAVLSIPSGPAVDFTTDRTPIRAALAHSIGRAARPAVTDNFSMSLQELFAFDLGATVDERLTQQTILFRECPATMPARDLCETALRDDAEARLESYRERSRTAMGGLNKLFRALAAMSGPKVVVLISEGLVLRPDHRDASSLSQLAALAVASRVTLYSVLLDGALVDLSEAGRTHSSTGAQDRAIEEDGLKALTSESGGVLLRAPAAPDGAFDRLANALSGYYLVSFRVTPADADGAHAIALRATRPGITVHARARFTVTTALRRPTVNDGVSSLTLDKTKLQINTRAIADANGTVRILFSLDVNDSAAHSSALALGLKLTSGGRVVADSGRVVPVSRGTDGSSQPISYIAFQGLPPGAYQLQLSVSDGSKHSAFVVHPVSARLHQIGPFTLSDLLLAPSAATADGPFPVPARLTATTRLVAGVEVTAGAAAAFARAAVRFEIASTRTDEIVAAQDVPLSADGALSQFVRATLDLSAASAGDYLARASIVVDGARVGMIDAPLQLAR